MKISIKAARVNAGLTQVELARKMNKSPTTVCRWENGYSRMSIEEFNRFCKICKVNKDDILM